MSITNTVPQKRNAIRLGVVCLLLGSAISAAFGEPTHLSDLEVPEQLLPDGPDEPANAAAKVEWNVQTGALRLSYDGKLLFRGQAKGATLSNVTTRKKQAVTQMLTLTGKGARLEGIVFAGDDAIVAETKGAAQRKFPLVRTTIGGPSRNLRNNAIYERERDWLLAGATRIEPIAAAQFRFVATGDVIELTFQPRFYQRHKNIAYFRPWTYQVRHDSITGWSSWWAYMRDFNERELDQLLAVWKEKHFADYGYRFIQIDDCYQGGEDAPHHLRPNNGDAGTPETWLDWRGDLFPSGLTGYVAAVKQAGFEPGVWISSHFGDTDIAAQHPDWFVRDAAGKPFVGPWIGYAIDASNPQAVDTLVRPTYRGLKQAGVVYVKIDTLRHYLYDNLNHNLDYCRGRDSAPAEILRDYLRAARQELGTNTFLLACWGVLPETVGLADACRIGGDGYGPFTMQQYNSWNGIVWRNDPDHCDVYPHFKPAEAGNVTKTAAVAAAPADTIIRPALASIAGCMLMLSDKPAVYRDDANLEGLRRAAPVLFSVPGQLYDFDDSKTRNLVAMQRTDITAGAHPSPIDATQFGPVCPWWLNEFDRPFEYWNVLHRLNWSRNPGDKTVLKFEDIGLDGGQTYLVYEFWSRKFLGAFRGSVELPAIKPMGLDSFAIREQLDHPQIVSTSRHLSQGGLDLVAVEWKANILAGKSRVVAGDPYQIALHVPPDFDLRSAAIAGQPAEIAREGELARVSFVPATTGEVEWQMTFNSKKP
jgi:alpha-galactosidase